ncbi:MAG: DUF58 domain-containing protein [Planctomycetes bacterium]|nr:DUF58 domain-containing protein [Planctomycetota bacterium]
MADKSVDPAVLDRLEGLELVARTVVEGFMAGHHRSPLRGSSAEFAQHREYVPGDELRRLDWKVFARSDRLVVKEYFEETNLSCHLLLDASESMAFGSLAWSKFDYARWCAAALAHLVLASRDTAGLVVFDQKEKAKVPPKTGEGQERTIFDALAKAEASGPTGVGATLQWLATRLKSRGIVAVFSDFFDEPETIVAGLRRLVHSGHEPILFQVLDPLETTFSLDHLVRFDGLEASGQLKVDPKAIRAAYLEEFGAHTALLKKHARALSLDFVELSTKQPLDAALSTYLARRTARARGGRR